MPPHGGNMIGATHSHNPEYPDDSWNLYSMLDSSTTALNVTHPSDTIGIFKPHALRLNPTPELFSDADAEIIVIARFISPVSVRKIMIIGGGDNTNNHPSRLRCYVNQDAFDFSSTSSVAHAQEFNIPVNTNGTVELTTSIHPFTAINSLTFYFSANHGDEELTRIRYIGLQGEHTHYRREAVNAVYEVLCNGQDIHAPEESSMSTSGHLH